MDKKNLKGMLLELNRQIKKVDELYRSLANSYDLSDSALWIVYSIRLSDEPVTQSNLSNLLSLSKQTINSSLKKLIETGYIVLSSTDDNKKNKIISLTEKGKRIAEKAADGVIDSEVKAIENMSVEKAKLFISLYEEYAMNLKEQFDKLNRSGI